jgi:hypothetical protein
MALIKCKECGAEVSSKAETCPKCGARVAAKPMGCGTLVGVVLLGGIIISVFSSIFSSSTTTTDTASSLQTSTAAETVSEPSLPSSQWTYYQTDDDMGKGVVYTAHVSSTNTVEFSFPYSGEQHATIFLRTHPRWGKNLYFRIEKGQLLCNSYDGCNVLVRFDDGAAMNFSAIGPEDNSTEVLFIQNYGRFVEKMLKAKRIRIAVDVYQEGAPTFEFDVSDFDQDKYKPKS